MDLNFVRSMNMPVETDLPVFGQRIMSSPITLSAFLRPVKYTDEMIAV